MDHPLQHSNVHFSICTVLRCLPKHSPSPLQSLPCGSCKQFWEDWAKFLGKGVGRVLGRVLGSLGPSSLHAWASHRCPSHTRVELVSVRCPLMRGAVAGPEPGPSSLRWGADKGARLRAQHGATHAEVPASQRPTPATIPPPPHPTRPSHGHPTAPLPRPPPYHQGKPWSPNRFFSPVTGRNQGGGQQDEPKIRARNTSGTHLGTTLQVDENRTRAELESN